MPPEGTEEAETITVLGRDGFNASTTLALPRVIAGPESIRLGFVILRSSVGTTALPNGASPVLLTGEPRDRHAASTVQCETGSWSDDSLIKASTMHPAEHLALDCIERMIEMRVDALDKSDDVFCKTIDFGDDVFYEQSAIGSQCWMYVGDRSPFLAEEARPDGSVRKLRS
jgi:hypothetical protein